MAAAYASATTKIATGAAAGNVGAVVDELVSLAFSVTRCREKCKVLADKVASVHKAIVTLEENPAMFDTNDIRSNVSKFLCVVQDCVSLVKKYKTKNWVVRILLSLKLESDFDSLDARLEQCMRYFKLDLQLETATTVKAMNAAMVEEFRQYQQNIDEVKSLLQQSQSSQEQDSSSVPGTIFCGDSIYGGYLLEGTMEASGTTTNVLLFNTQQANHEAAIMKLVSDCDYILQFFGTYLHQNNSYNVMERPGAQILTLDERIKVDRTLTDPVLRNDWRLKRQVALDIATGLGYLHCAGILHRNLRSPNIFLTDDHLPKLFGLFQARMKVKPSEKKWTNVEQFRWAAPEMLPKTRPQFTEKCDIFSLGAVLWEIIMDEYPFSDIDSAMQLLPKRIKRERKLEFPGDQSIPLLGFYKEFVQIARDCMDELAENRPEIGTIIDRLTKLQPEEMQARTI